MLHSTLFLMSLNVESKARAKIFFSLGTCVGQTHASILKTDSIVNR